MQGVAKRLKIGVGIFALIGGITLSTTLASNISLNDGGNVEFGQGIAATTACDSNVVITPTSTFVNSESAGEFMFTSIKISDISDSCFGKVFTIKAYKNGENSPLQLYKTGYEGAPFDVYSEIQVEDLSGTFNLLNAGLLSDDITSTDTDNFTVTFVTAGPPPSQALSSAQDVDRITIESSGSSLVAYWNFNNASALGSSTLGNFNLFSCGNPGSGDGLNNSGGLELNGYSYLASSAAPSAQPACNPGGFVSIPSALLGDATYSMSAWFKANGGSTNGGIMGWGSTYCGGTTNLRFWENYNGFANYWWGCDLTSAVPNLSSYIDGQWHFIVATYDGQYRKMYFDGDLFATDTPGVTPDFQNNQFLIGATIGDVAFTGTLDNVGVYSEALSAADIANLYNSQL